MYCYLTGTGGIDLFHFNVVELCRIIGGDIVKIESFDFVHDTRIETTFSTEFRPLAQFYGCNYIRKDGYDKKSLCDSKQTAFILRSESQSSNGTGHLQKRTEFVSVHCDDVHLLLQMLGKNMSCRQNENHHRIKLSILSRTKNRICFNQTQLDHILHSTLFEIRSSLFFSLCAHFVH